MAKVDAAGILRALLPRHSASEAAQVLGSADVIHVVPDKQAQASHVRNGSVEALCLYLWEGPVGEDMGKNGMLQHSEAAWALVLLLSECEEGARRFVDVTVAQLGAQADLEMVYTVLSHVLGHPLLLFPHSDDAAVPPVHEKFVAAFGAEKLLEIYSGCTRVLVGERGLQSLRNVRRTRAPKSGAGALYGTLDSASQASTARVQSMQSHPQQHDPNYIASPKSMRRGQLDFNSNNNNNNNPMGPFPLSQQESFGTLLDAATSNNSARTTAREDNQSQSQSQQQQQQQQQQHGSSASTPGEDYPRHLDHRPPVPRLHLPDRNHDGANVLPSRASRRALPQHAQSTEFLGMVMSTRRSTVTMRSLMLDTSLDEGDDTLSHMLSPHAEHGNVLPDGFLKALGFNLGETFVAQNVGALLTMKREADMLKSARLTRPTSFLVPPQSKRGLSVSAGGAAARGTPSSTMLLSAAARAAGSSGQMHRSSKGLLNRNAAATTGAAGAAAGAKGARAGAGTGAGAGQGTSGGAGASAGGSRHRPSKHDEGAAVFRQHKHYRIKCSILDILSHLCSVEPLVRQFRSVVNVLYCDAVMSYSQRFFAEDEEFRLRLFKVLRFASYAVEATHTRDELWLKRIVNPSKAALAAMGNTEQSAADTALGTMRRRNRLNGFLWRLQQRLTVLADNGLPPAMFHDAHSSLAMLDHYLSACRTSMSVLELGQGVLEQMMRVMRLLGYRSREKHTSNVYHVTFLQLVARALRVLALIIRHSCHPVMDELLLQLVVMERELFSWLRSFGTIMLLSTSVEQTLSKTEIGLQCLHDIREQWAVVMTEIVYLCGRVGVARTRTSTFTTSSSHQYQQHHHQQQQQQQQPQQQPQQQQQQQQQQYKKALFASASASASAISHDGMFPVHLGAGMGLGSTMSVDRNAARPSVQELLAKFDYIINPDTGMALRFLQSAEVHPVDVQVAMISLVAALFAHPSSPYSMHKEYTDPVVSLSYLAFVKLYKLDEHGGTPEDKALVMKAHLRVLLTLSTRKNPAIVRKFYQLQIVDFLAREIALEHEMEAKLDLFMRRRGEYHQQQKKQTGTNNRNKTQQGTSGVQGNGHADDVADDGGMPLYHDEKEVEDVQSDEDVCDDGGEDLADDASSSSSVYFYQEPPKKNPLIPSLAFGGSMLKGGTEKSTMDNKAPPPPAAAASAASKPTEEKQPLLAANGHAEEEEEKDDDDGASSSSSVYFYQQPVKKNPLIPSLAFGNTMVKGGVEGKEDGGNADVKPKSEESEKMNNNKDAGAVGDDHDDDHDDDASSSSSVYFYQEPVKKNPLIPSLAFGKDMLKGEDSAAKNNNNNNNEVPTLGGEQATMSVPEALGVAATPAYQKNNNANGVQNDVSELELSIGHGLDPVSSIGFYAQECEARPLYHNDELHALMVHLLVVSILKPQSTMLEHLYTDQFPLLNNKLNVLYMLDKHLNHHANSYLLSHLMTQCTELGPSPARMMRLLWRRPFHGTLGDMIGSGAYGNVHIWLPDEDEKTTPAPHDQAGAAGLPQYVIKVVEIPSSVHERCVAHDIFTEIAVMEQLRGTNLVSEMADYGLSDLHYWIKMRRYAGTLRQWRLQPAIGETSFQDMLPRYLDLFGQVLQTYEAFNQRNIIHFDLKCDNIFVESMDANTAPSLVLGDFGSALAFADPADAFTLQSRGTECIMSPEMLKIATANRKDGPGYDRRRRTGAGAPSDIWSLGCLFYELLTGDYLYNDDDPAVVFFHVTAAEAPIVAKDKLEAIANDARLRDFLEFVLIRDANLRPTIADVQMRFRQMRASMALSAVANPGSRDHAIRALHMPAADGGRLSRPSWLQRPFAVVPDHPFTHYMRRAPPTSKQSNDKQQKSGGGGGGGHDEEENESDDEEDGSEVWPFGVSCVLDHLYLCSVDTAMNIQYLKAQLGITHVVWVSHFPYRFATFFSTLHLNAIDSDVQDVIGFAAELEEFVQDAVLKGSKVLFCSVDESSLAPALVMLYLIHSRGVDFSSAQHLVMRAHASSHVPSGLLEQLQSKASHDAASRARETLAALKACGASTANPNHTASGATTMLMFQCICGLCTIKMNVPFDVDARATMLPIGVGDEAEDGSGNPCWCSCGPDDASGNCPCGAGTSCAAEAARAYRLHHDVSVQNGLAWGFAKADDVVGTFMANSTAVPALRGSSGGAGWSLFACTRCRFPTYAAHPTASASSSSSPIALVVNHEVVAHAPMDLRPALLFRGHPAL